jgi:peptide chain release factor 1
MNVDCDILDSDLIIEWYSGTGAGGQHRNKHQNSCRIKHIPSGIIVKSETRSRNNSLNNAKKELEERYIIMKTNTDLNDLSVKRKQQIGSGMRGDKIRTYRFQDDIVQDHKTNKRSSVSKVLKGNFDLLW